MTKWIFGYTSLMWDPGFDYEDSEPARVFGYHRSLCVYSHLYRGTPEQPGLVAGLLPSGTCKGRAFRVTNTQWPAVKSYLHGREMVYGVYQPKWMTAQLRQRRIPVYGFSADPAHPQFAGRLTDDSAAELISRGRGISGSGTAYLSNLIDHLAALGIRDQGLTRIAALCGARGA